MGPFVDQRDASADGDIVGRDKIENHFHGDRRLGVVEELLTKLQAEIEQNCQIRHTVEALAHFHTRRSRDGIDGLEAKLKAGNRDDEYYDALEKKELFAKLLEKWSLYASAQEIFAYLLAKTDYEFNQFVHPQIELLTRIQINQIVKEHIVVPTVGECGGAVFTINHSTAMGMIYWLAEQCFIRWHK
ncbi:MULTISPECIES: ABC-three component system protein [Rhodopseudomonas]|uniref:ABC-three component systems C-terminal domain-containing protein n=1 Tax=Rhodopseudomonas palustris TaxID=1076 RepID=A0A0D7F2M1_RHOPL|nr:MULTISPECIES: ABC-three component system protein [Rhodopseudomonas]KIZ47323.1 hypothetical protein OO17_04910 [Rhodopseudomonas palustris]MDF3809317.1 hypothetical protein [Rhodopseudomonas sp. BAL398]WOK19002.1 hypothetical protein RBJ75_05640 [Rhodopseudomonas sp. BAL398]